MRGDFAHQHGRRRDKKRVMIMNRRAAVAERVSIPVIASGGAGAKEHFYDALTAGKADAVLAASLFHYKELEIRDLKPISGRPGDFGAAVKGKKENSRRKPVNDKKKNKRKRRRFMAAITNDWLTPLEGEFKKPHCQEAL